MDNIDYPYLIEYTRRELKSDPYYIDAIKVLKENEITSYLDLGSNVGEFCNILFEEIPSLQEAHLVEMESNVLEYSKTNVKSPNVTFYNASISYLKQVYATNLGNSLTVRLTQSPTENTIDNLKTLEELNLPIVDLIKMDIEGMEYNIIENSSYIQQIKWLDIEFHDIFTYPTKQYLETHFPNHEIVVIDLKRGGNCLLRKI